MPIKLSEIRKLKWEVFENVLGDFVRVLSFLLDHYDEAYTVKELAKATGIDKKRVEKVLNLLDVLGHVGTERVGGKTYFYVRLNADGRVDSWVSFHEARLNLTPDMINRRRYLTEKLKANTISPEEIDELIHILDVEEKVARKLGEYYVVVDIAVLKILAKVRKNELAKQEAHD